MHKPLFAAAYAAFHHSLIFVAAPRVVVGVCAPNVAFNRGQDQSSAQSVQPDWHWVAPALVLGRFLESNHSTHDDIIPVQHQLLDGCCPARLIARVCCRWWVL
jgi:hypothetical protein